MQTRMRELFVALWQDDEGAVITTEYLTLGTIVVLGGTTGLAAMRDAAVNEMKEYGRSVQNVNQSYRVASQSNGLASKPGSAVVDTPPADCASLSP